MARTSNTKSGESGHHCLVPDLRGKVFSFECDISCELVRYDLYYVYYERVCSLYTHFVDNFHHKLVLNFVKRFVYPY